MPVGARMRKVLLTSCCAGRSPDAGGVTSESDQSKRSHWIVVPTASVFFGDYINIAALAGHVYPIWMRLDGQELSVWMAMVDETAGVPAPLPGDSGSAPLLVAANPWRPGAPISFELGHAARVNVSVFNSGGRLVRTLVDAPRGAGRHSLSWDGDGAGAGVYFLSIAADGATNVKKLVVLD